MSLAAFLAFAFLTLLGAISPGPAVLMSARTGLNEGFRTGALLAVLFTFETGGTSSSRGSSRLTGRAPPISA